MVVLKNGGNYLKGSDARKGAVVKILTEGEWIKSDKFKNPDGSEKFTFEIQIEYENEKKTLRLNKASRTAMIEAFGEETRNWIDKRAKLIIMPTPQGDKKMIVLDPMPLKVDKSDELGWDEKL